MAKKVETSGFAIIDVTKGRKKLARALAGAGNPKLGRPAFGYPVTITGYLTSQHSRDDGTSIEFSIDVTNFALSDIERLP